ncbi:MAG: oxalate/formate MFS antiporter, partial [Telluria sp.]
MANSSAATLSKPVSSNTRWVQLLVGVVCMIATANIQYAWTLFVPEIQTTYGWSRAKIQLAFTIFVLVQTWLAPIEG